MMTAHDWIYVASGALTLLNVYLTLRVQLAVTESREAILKTVREDYYDKETIDAKLERLEALIAAASPRRVA
jgi:hypothetical protein